LGIKAKSIKGRSVVRISVGEVSKEITIYNQEFEVIPVGYFDISEEGYISG
jgi:hypothetical protein